MPLPKPPATRAALLSAADYESQSAPKTSRRSQKAAEPTSKLLDLHDDRAETAVASRLVQLNLDENRQKQLVEEYLSKLPKETRV